MPTPSKPVVPVAKKEMVEWLSLRWSPQISPFFDKMMLDNFAKFPCLGVRQDRMWSGAAVTAPWIIPPPTVWHNGNKISEYERETTLTIPGIFSPPFGLTFGDTSEAASEPVIMVYGYARYKKWVEIEITTHLGQPRLERQTPDEVKITTYTDHEFVEAFDDPRHIVKMIQARFGQIIEERQALLAQASNARGTVVSELKDLIARMSGVEGDEHQDCLPASLYSPSLRVIASERDMETSMLPVTYWLKPGERICQHCCRIIPEDETCPHFGLPE